MKNMVRSNQERIEDTARMAIIETDIKHIKQTLDRFQKSIDETNKRIESTNNKISGFIDSANQLYATKIELDAIRDVIKTHEKTSRDWVKAIVPWLISAAVLVLAIISYYR